MNLKETVWEVVEWFHTTHNSDQWRVLVNKKIKLQVPEYAENVNGMSNCQLLKTCTAVCSLLTAYPSDAATDILSAPSISKYSYKQSGVYNPVCVNQYDVSRSWHCRLFFVNPKGNPRSHYLRLLYLEQRACCGFLFARFFKVNAANLILFCLHPTV
jgi:hypothetical protein